MTWYDKLERRFGNFYIPNLMIGVVLVQGVVWLLQRLMHASWIAQMFSLQSAAVLHGQVWRLFTFIFLPGSYSNPIFLFLSLYFYYVIGQSLENRWGGFRFNLYYLVGMAGAWCCSLLAGAWDNGGLLLSLFLAFAWLYPDMQVLLFYIIPIKVKWLGLAAALMWAWDVITYPGIYRLCPILELAGFLVFFGPDVWRTVRDWFINRGRRNDWNNQWRR